MKSGFLKLLSLSAAICTGFSGLVPTYQDFPARQKVPLNREFPTGMKVPTCLLLPTTPKILAVLGLPVQDSMKYPPVYSATASFTGTSLQNTLCSSQALLAAESIHRVGIQLCHYITNSSLGDTGQNTHPGDSTALPTLPDDWEITPEQLPNSVPKDWQLQQLKSAFRNSSSDLEENIWDDAISSALLEYALEQSPYGCQSGESVYVCESHFVLGTETTCHPETDQDEAAFQEVSFYVMAQYQVFEPAREDSITSIESRYFPALLTFSLSEIPNGIWSLKDAWFMGKNYFWVDNQEDCETELREHFPEETAEEALRQLTSQPFIDAHTQACYTQAIQHWELDTDHMVEMLLDTIMSSPRESSNPYDYVTEHPAEYIALHYYGGYTLRYIFSEFLKGGQTGLKGTLMMQILDEMTDGNVSKNSLGEAGITSQDNFDIWLQKAETLEETQGMTWLAENEIFMWMLLSMPQKS